MGISERYAYRTEIWLLPGVTQANIGHNPRHRSISRFGFAGAVFGRPRSAPAPTQCEPRAVTVHAIPAHAAAGSLYVPEALGPFEQLCGRKVDVGG